MGAVGCEVEARGYAIGGSLAGARSVLLGTVSEMIVNSHEEWLVTGVLHVEPTERSNSGWETKAEEETARERMVKMLRECIVLRCLNECQAKMYSMLSD